MKRKSKTHEWGHYVSAQDSKRVRCNDIDCDGKPAYACKYMRWLANGQSGISFFYYCKEHTEAHGFIRSEHTKIKVY
jgi:hypothetical protein